MAVKGRDLIKIIKDKVYSEDLIKELEKYEVKRPRNVWELEFDDEILVTVYDHSHEKYVVLGALWRDWASQERRRELGMVHLTEERAELHARVLDTELTIRKWKRENDNIELDWGNKRQHKNFLTYDYQDGEIRTDWWGTFKYANTIYFSSDSKARQCIVDIGEEKIIEWLKWEDNDQ